MLHAREGDKVLIVKNSYPESGLWNNAGMVATIGQIGTIKSIGSGWAVGAEFCYQVKFDDPSFNNYDEGWWYHGPDFEVISDETLITF